MNARIENFLKAYNLIQLTGWMMAIFALPFSFLFSLYTIVTVQFLSLSEIYFAYKRWNKSSPLFCFVQIIARLLILFLTFVIVLISIFRKIPFIDEVIYIMLVAWCIAEIVRYAYYVTQLFNKENKSITWLRYSVFIGCYPVGVICEFYILFAIFKYNDQLEIKILIILIAIIYMYFFPKLYKHLFIQRTQKINK